MISRDTPKNIKIAALEKEDLLKLRNLINDELLRTLPDDMIILGGIDVSGNDPQTVALLIFHVREKSAYIDWLYVDENFRRKGIGSFLLSDLMSALIKDPGAGIEVIFMSFGETITGMGAFLRKNRFAVTFFDGNFNIYAPLKSVKLIKKNENEKHLLRSVPLAEVKPESFEAFDRYLDMTSDEITGFVDPIEPSDFRPESRVIMQGDKIVGIMLVGDTVYKGTVFIEWVYSVPKFVLSAVPLAFNDVITALRESLPEDAMLSMAAMSENVGGIIRRTMPGAVFSEAYSAFWLVER